jgi:large subunit ribosomal protein L47
MASSSGLRPPLIRLASSCPRLSAHPLAKPPSSRAIASTSSSFSTSAAQHKRITRDNNRHRGVSSLYRSGPREHTSVSDDPIPKPANFTPKVKTDEKHGLWSFFYGVDKLINTPTEDAAHGRAWTVEELRRKDWNDLHALWWVCVKERNRISTANAERVRARMGFGDHEAVERDETVRS